MRARYILAALGLLLLLAWYQWASTRHLRHYGDREFNNTGFIMRDLTGAAHAYARAHGLGLALAYEALLKDEAHLRSLPFFLARPLQMKDGVPLDGYGHPIRIYSGGDNHLVLWSAGGDGRFQDARSGDILWLVTPNLSSGGITPEQADEAIRAADRKAAATAPATSPSRPTSEQSFRAAVPAVTEPA